MNRNLVYRSVLPVVAVLAAARFARRTSPMQLGARVTRRTLIKLAGLGVTALATGIWKSRNAEGASAKNTIESTVSCVLTPEQTEGPYYIPHEKVRKNITERRSGTPLKLQLAVVDATTCKPIKGAAVDIWHCDAGGIYAGFQSASAGGPPGGSSGPTDKATFLRGIQFTNSKGMSEFQTIYPGWYRGRTVHIHVKVHLGGAAGRVVHTGQLFFPDSLTSKVYQSTPYKARAAARDTFNSGDSIYQSGGVQSTLSLKRDGHGGFIGTIALGVRRS